MGRPARLRARLGEQDQTMSGGVVDVSSDGCRLALPCRGLAPEWTWTGCDEYLLTIEVYPQVFFSTPAEVVWSQRHREGFDILGVKFKELPEEARHSIENFIMIRLRAGVKIPEQGARSASQRSVATTAPLAPLEVALQAVLTCGTGTQKITSLCRVTKLNDRQLTVAPDAERKGELPAQLPIGTVVDLQVNPPSWAGVSKRSLQFAARLQEISPTEARLDFHLPDCDLAQMIRALIPARIVRQEKPAEVDFKLVLLIVAAIVIALLISSLNHPR